MLLSPEDFIGEANIPNADDRATSENLQWFIDKYEPKYLKALLGRELYSQLLTGVQTSPVLDKWTNLVADVIPGLTFYVYWHWLKSENSYANRGGVSRKKSENADNVSPAERMVASWNDMVDGNRDIVKVWDEGVYGAYYSNPRFSTDRDVRDIFTHQNTFNI